MNRLFIQLYLDEDVDVLVAELIRARGYGARTALEEGRLAQPDDEQLAYAVGQQWTLLTHNRADFEALAREYVTAGKSHYGIVIARRHSPYEIVRRLLLILDKVTADEMQNQLRYI